MTRALRMLLVPLAAAWLTMATARAQAGGPVVALRLDGTVDPASLAYLQRALGEANERRAELILIELDTPGGLLVSLREMTSAIMASQAPVAVWVAPPGAHAASAGFFLVLAADIAAMAPGTTTGAAHPVMLGGGGGGSEKADDNPGMRKAVEDAASFARSLAAQRGRPEDLAEEAVTEARSYSAREALDEGLIDTVQATREALLAWADGRTVTRLSGETVTLSLRGAAVEKIGPTRTERLLMRVARPEVAYLLMLLGMLALFVELSSPGLVGPGVVGVVALLLGLFGFSVLPVNAVGALLIALGIAMFIAEVFVTSYGVLTAGGVIAFVLGSLMLVDTPVPSWRVSPELVFPSALVMAAIVMLLMRQVLRIRRSPPRAGIEELVGQTAEVVTPDGKVFIHGEYWSAVFNRPVSPGARVRVVGIEGHRLAVEPLT